MRKILLILIPLLMLLSINVYADEYENENEIKCSEWEIENGKEALKDLTYNLEYDNEYLDRNGDFQEGYFRIDFSNFPEAYRIEIAQGDNSYSDSSSLVGGVYTVQIYRNNCNSIIKMFEIRIPMFKYYCDIDENCAENVWFDGTYPSSPKNEDEDKKFHINITLIIILLVLIFVLAIIIFIIMKRRHKNEISF